jgi:DtxR family Mn-dependent transcriptional regulator
MRQVKRGSKSSKEDYLRVIYELENKEGVKNIQIARNLHISKPSVSQMLNKLKQNKLVTFKPYSPCYLTQKGKQQAEQLTKKYELIKIFAEKLKHSNPKEQAHLLEHHNSDEFFNKLADFLEIKPQQPIPRYIR